MTIHQSQTNDNDDKVPVPNINNISIRYKILLVCALTLAAVGLVTFSVNLRGMEDAADQKLLATAQAFFQQIVITRRWVAQHGGVYVVKSPGVETNPYLLEIPDLVVDITDAQGQTYTLRNPALVTRELSEIAEQDGIFQFHITSLNLLNPNNAPDAFETEALQAFETGADEVWRYEGAGSGRRLRYMAPLYVEKSCLRCHGDQGYSVGQVRGGISVTVPALASPASTYLIQIGIWTLGTLIVLGILYWALNIIIIRPIERLRLATEAIAAGNYENSLPPASNDEIGDLAQAYERMRSQVRQYTRSLEEMVAQRTADLSQSEEKYRSLVEQSGEAIVLVDNQGLIVEWNQQAVQTFGRSREAALGQQLSEIMLQMMPGERRAAAARQQLESQLSEFFRTQQAPWLNKRVEIAVERPDGTPGVLQAMVFPIQSKSGFMAGSILRDITEQKAAETAVQAAEQRFRTLFNEAPVMYVVTKNQAGVPFVANCNRLFLDTLGYRREEVVGRPLADFYAPESQDALLAGGGYDRALTGQFDTEGRKLLTRDGRVIETLLQAAPETDPAGNLFGTRAMFVDVTKQVKAEEALRDSNIYLEKVLAELKETQAQMVQQERLAAVGQLAAGIAHDFNNLMATVILYSELMMYGSNLTPADQERVATIRQQGERAANLTQQILDFSRKSIMKRQTLDLRPFLKEMTKLLGRTLPENIRLSLDSQADEYIVHADPTRFQQVIINLVINARDAMPTGGQLRLALARVQVNEVGGGKRPLPTLEPGSWIQITVADTGTGIPPDSLPHIFEPFFTTKLPQGSGLGLSQVYGIVKQHNGEINVTTQIGQGTTFTIYLPALTTPQSTTKDSQWSQLTQGRGETILVAEDDTNLRQALIDTLQALSYHVLSAANGQEAINICRQHSSTISLIITDLVMPEMGGTTLLKTVREINPVIKSIIITGYPTKSLNIELQSAGTVGWLQKPLNMEQLSQMVANALQ